MNSSHYLSSKELLKFFMQISAGERDNAEIWNLMQTMEPGVQIRINGQKLHGHQRLYNTVLA